MMTPINSTFSLSKLGENDMQNIDIFDALRQVRKWGGKADNFGAWVTEAGTTYRTADWYYDDGRVFGGKIVEVKNK
jgi:hypothetical protein